MRQTLTLSFLASASILASTLVSAAELSVEGNAPGSQNSLVVNSGSTINKLGQNTGGISTFIDVNSATGGNSASGNSGGSTITTGDSTIDIKVRNILNSNFSQAGCCDPTPTFTPTPPPNPANSVNPTPTPSSSPPASIGSSSSSSQSSSSEGGIGAGQVLGLPVTSSSSPTSSAVTSLGLACLTLAAIHLKSAFVS